ncbi:hypothetical protein CDG77_12070 [Nostoc sp. 'Peltigera membranacea cyanobiont' 213]|nr:hypothetical protein CDG77_12070 [Nostoc sp. 'Peltigera membranacea cyanobiont' 213]
MAAQPTSSVPQACGTLAATTAAYDLWSSPYIIERYHYTLKLAFIKKDVTNG